MTLPEAVMLAARDLQHALLAREEAKARFRISVIPPSGGPINRLALTEIPQPVRVAAERVSAARLALDLALLESA